MKPIDDIIVVGTDTGVGKTVVSLLLMQLLFAKGYSPFYFKPFQTGCRSPLDADSDARFVYSYTFSLNQSNPSESMLYCLPAPRAPYFAASDFGQSIDPKRVIEIIQQKRRTHSPIIVEAAGGLLVPLTEQTLLADFIEPSGCSPLLVARSGLGTINHTLLSIEALHRRGLSPMGIVFVDGASPKADPELVAENIAAVEMYTDCSVSGVISRIANFNSPSPTLYQPLEKILF
jgi:dethiobiotin synthetase